MHMHVFARDGHCSHLQLHIVPSFVHSFIHLLIMLAPGVEVYTVLSSCLYEFLFWETAAAHALCNLYDTLWQIYTLTRCVVQGLHS